MIIYHAIGRQMDPHVGTVLISYGILLSAFVASPGRSRYAASIYVTIIRFRMEGRAWTIL